MNAMFYARNVRKAAELELSKSPDQTLTLRLIDGMTGEVIKTRQYKTVRGLLNNGRKVSCVFNHYSDWTAPLRFESTY